MTHATAVVACFGVFLVLVALLRRPPFHLPEHPEQLLPHVPREFHPAVAQAVPLAEVPPVPAPGPVPDVPTTPAPSPAPVTPSPVLANCNVNIRPGQNGWYAGFDIGFDVASVVLDFTNTGLDLATITLDSGNFQAAVDGPFITLVAPDWVSSTSTGYMGMNGNNNAGLASFTAPLCAAARRMLRA